MPRLLLEVDLEEELEYEEREDERLLLLLPLDLLRPPRPLDRDLVSDRDIVLRGPSL